MGRFPYSVPSFDQKKSEGSARRTSSGIRGCFQKVGQMNTVLNERFTATNPRYPRLNSISCAAHLLFYLRLKFIPLMQFNDCRVKGSGTWFCDNTRYNTGGKFQDSLPSFERLGVRGLLDVPAYPVLMAAESITVFFVENLLIVIA